MGVTSGRHRRKRARRRRLVAVQQRGHGVHRDKPQRQQQVRAATEDRPFVQVRQEEARRREGPQAPRWISLHESYHDC